MSTPNIYLFGEQREQSGPVYIIFSCSTQLSMKFKLLIKTRMLKSKDLLVSNSQMLYLSINVKMSTIVSMISSMLS